MKELTTEQKAQRYDEALEKSKRLYEQGTITESLCYVFPELAESEDERIRKAIINVFAKHKDYESFFGASVKDILAWLEKQGEQKPAWSEEDERMYRGLHNLIYSTPYCDSRKELSDWLELLKERYTWKPSDEQIEALDRMVNFAHFDEVGNRDMVRILLNELKKLRVE